MIVRELQLSGHGSVVSGKTIRLLVYHKIINKWGNTTNYRTYRKIIREISNTQTIKDSR